MVSEFQQSCRRCRRYCRSVLLIALILTKSLLVQPVLAEGLAVDAVANSKGNLIIGAAWIPDYIGSDDYQSVPMVISNFYLAGYKGIFEGTGGRLDLWDHPYLEAGPVLNLSLPRKNIDSRAVELVSEFDAAIEAGAYLGFAMPYTKLPEGLLSGYIQVRSAVGNKQEGTQLLSQLEYFFAPKFFLRLGFTVTAIAADSEYNNFQFGVSPAASERSGLPTFRAGSGARDVAVAAYSVLSLSPRWGIFSRVLASRVLGDARRSPIVSEEGSDEQFFFGLGLFLNFL